MSANLDSKTGADPTAQTRALAAMAVESWRFARLFARLVNNLDAGQRGRFSSQLHWFLKRLEEALASADLKLVDLEGLRFEPGVAASPLNAADFGPDDVLVVEQMVEPTILGPNGLLHSGTVLLRKEES